MNDSPSSPHISLATIAMYNDVAELAFTPVPVRARHDGWTPVRQRDFIAVLSLHGCVAEAARAVGKSTASAYNLRGREGAESFASAWDKAIEWGTGVSLFTAHSRALHGEVRPIYRGGRKVADVVRHNDRLLIAVLNNQWRRKAAKKQLRKAARHALRKAGLLPTAATEKQREK